MRNLLRLSSASGVLLAFGLAASIVTPIVINIPVSAQNQAPATVRPTFSDLNGYWAAPFIQTLAARNVISGYPDGQFKPNEPVERAEFAAMLQKAFNQPAVRQLTSGGFTDVPADHWAASAIEKAYESGFMSGYSADRFYPNEGITKTQAIVALANGLRLTANGSPATILSSYYTDDEQIPSYALAPVAAATQGNIVVNYPNVKVIKPNDVLTRGEAAALIHQALVNRRILQPIASGNVTNYIVGSTTVSNRNLTPNTR